jgi:hypothetical protein
LDHVFEKGADKENRAYSSQNEGLPAGVGAAQQNEYDTNAGPRLLMTSGDVDDSRVQTLLSVLRIKVSEPENLQPQVEPHHQPQVEPHQQR